MIYQNHNCWIEVARGGQTAWVWRDELRFGDAIERCAVAKVEFKTKVEKRDGLDVSVSAQEQATLFARSLPDVIEVEAEEPTEVDE